MALEAMNHIFSEETGQRMAEALDRQNTLLAGIAVGNAGADYIDASFAALLDGTNTQTVFEAWWPLSAGDTVTKYQRLARFFRMLAKAWSKKTYTVRNIHESVSGDDAGTPLDDLADGRSAAPLVTDASAATADWSENDPMTWYIRANAKSLIDGTMEILAIEGEEGFDIYGEIAPVYAFSAALAVKEWNDGSYLYTSWRMHTGGGYKPMAGDVAPDGTQRPMSWHPAFYGGKNSAGGMTSGAYLLPMPWTSANDGNTAAKKQTAYDGLWNDCDTQWALMEWRLRHWTLSNSGHLEGCTNYNIQCTLALAETGVKRILLTKENGARLLVGSCVCLGEHGSNTSNDRNQSYNHDIFNIAKITSIANVTIEGAEYAAVNLDPAQAPSTRPRPCWSARCRGRPAQRSACMATVMAASAVLPMAATLTAWQALRCRSAATRSSWTRCGRPALWMTTGGMRFTPAETAQNWRAALPATTRRSGSSTCRTQTSGTGTTSAL